MKQLILVGTTRKGSYTGYVANAVEEEFSIEHDVKVFDLKERKVPPMEERLSHSENPPQDIVEFAEMVKWCDLLTIVTPEYNHSIPGPLKNCLDYLYPEYGDKAFSYVTVSAGGFGGVRCQSHLHDITLALGGHAGPNMPVSNVRDHFNGQVSEEYHKRITAFREKCESFL